MSPPCFAWCAYYLHAISISDLYFSLPSIGSRGTILIYVRRLAPNRVPALCTLLLSNIIQSTVHSIVLQNIVQKERAAGLNHSYLAPTSSSCLKQTTHMRRPKCINKASSLNSPTPLPLLDRLKPHTRMRVSALANPLRMTQPRRIVIDPISVPPVDQLFANKKHEIHLPCPTMLFNFTSSAA